MLSGFSKAAYLQATKVNMVRRAIAAFFSGLLPWKLQKTLVLDQAISDNAVLSRLLAVLTHLSEGTYIFATVQRLNAGI